MNRVGSGGTLTLVATSGNLMVQVAVIIIIEKTPVFVLLVQICFGWEAGTRTPIARFRVWSPTIGRPPSEEFEFTEV